MKKIYSLLLLFILNISGKAQYTINSTSNPVIGDIESYRKVDSTGLLFGSPGTGQIWNYGSAAIIYTAAPTSFSYLAVSSAPNNALFPGSNICAYNGSSYNMYNNSATKMENLGSASSSTTNCFVYTNPITMLTFPFSYGSSSVDPFAGTSPVYTVSGTFTATGHGSGTLILPTSSYPNVLKVRQAYTQTLTMTTATMVFNVMQDSYYSAISKFPLFSVGAQTIATITTSTSVSYNKGGQISSILVAGITEQNNNQFEFSVYPNPCTNGNVNLKFKLQSNISSELCIYNSMGQQVKVILFNGLQLGLTEKNIDLSDLESGFYYVKLKNGDREQIRNITISR